MPSPPDLTRGELGPITNPLVNILLYDLGQETLPTQEVDWAQVLTRSSLAFHQAIHSKPLRPPTIVLSTDLTGMEPFGELFWGDTAAAAITRDAYITVKGITLGQARRLALQALEAAEERRSMAAEAEADFIGDLLDSLSEENDQ